VKNEENYKESDEFLSCNLEDSFRKDFADLNSDQANIIDKNDEGLLNNKSKSSDKIYEVQKIILMLKIFNVSMHMLKFRDNKIKSNENVEFSSIFIIFHFF